MMRMMLWFMLIWLVCPNDGQAKVRVVTTTTDLAAIAEAVGGDYVDVQAIAKGYQDPHYVQAKPSYMRQMNRADLLVYVGMELEVGWLPLLIQGARNPKIVSGGPGHLDASVGIRRLDVPDGAVDRSMGDVHPEGNPHYWLDPRNGVIIARNIAKKLSALSPQHTDEFQAQLANFEAELMARIGRWEKQLVGFKGRKLVTYHKTWDYLADWLGFEIVAQVENKPGIPPSPRHIAGVVSRMQLDRIRLILSSNLIDENIARRVAVRAGAHLIVLPTSVGGEEELKTYFDFFEHIVGQLAAVDGDA